MARGEFERELEQYLAQRRRAKMKFPSITGFFKTKKKMPEPELPPEVHKYDETTPAEVPEPMPGEEAAEEQSRKGFFTRFLEGIGLVTVDQQQPEQIPTEEVQQMLAKDDLTQDTKEIARIALQVIKQLPPDQLSTFKASPEFDRLKELLKKHQLIK
jgi:hypothetical protein